MTVAVAVARDRVARPQRGTVVAALVGDDRPLVAGQLRVLRLEPLPLVPLPAQAGDVLAVTVVRAAPRLGHLLLREAGPGLAEQARPGGDLLRGATARRAAGRRSVDPDEPL